MIDNYVDNDADADDAADDRKGSYLTNLPSASERLLDLRIGVQYLSEKIAACHLENQVFGLGC